MKMLECKLNSIAWKARFKAQDIRDRAIAKLRDEEGDTNFISIIIVLAIVLLLAIVFIAFKDKIVKLINDTWDKFSQSFGGQTTGYAPSVTPP